MITEALILVPLLALLYAQLMSLSTGAALFIVCYMLPKAVFVSPLERFTTVVFRKPPAPTHKRVALTFDDVPYGTHTKELLAELNAQNIKATLFMISSYLKSPAEDEVLVQAIRDGHELANHGATNGCHALLPMKDLETEIKSCQYWIRRLYRVAGRPEPRLPSYRPGCGLTTPRMVRLVRELGHRLVLGSVYPNDPVVRWPWLNYWYLRSHIEPGDVVILHDRAWTVDLVRRIGPWLRGNDIQTVTLSELLDEPESKNAPLSNKEGTRW